MNVRPRDFNPYAVGNVVYNGSSSAPNTGMALDPMGYRERDARAKVRRNAVLRRMKAQNTRNFNAPDWLRDKG
jgi:hypothetical protein